MAGRVETSAEFFLRDEVVAEGASFDFLLAPQRTVPDGLAGLSSMRVLHLGVGAGRTTSQLPGRVGEYVGADPSPQMVQARRERFADRRRCRAAMLRSAPRPRASACCAPRGGRSGAL